MPAIFYAAKFALFCSCAFVIVVCARQDAGACPGRGLAVGIAPPRFKIEIHSSTPLRDLLPVAPKGLSAGKAVLCRDLAKAPEAQFGRAVAIRHEWLARTARDMGLEASLRPRGRWRGLTPDQPSIFDGGAGEGQHTMSPIAPVTYRGVPREKDVRDSSLLDDFARALAGIPCYVPWSTNLQPSPSPKTR